MTRAPPQPAAGGPAPALTPRDWIPALPFSPTSTLPPSTPKALHRPALFTMASSSPPKAALASSTTTRQPTLDLTPRLDRSPPPPQPSALLPPPIMPAAARARSGSASSTTTRRRLGNLFGSSASKQADRADKENKQRQSPPRSTTTTGAEDWTLVDGSTVDDANAEPAAGATARRRSSGDQGSAKPSISRFFHRRRSSATSIGGGTPTSGSSSTNLHSDADAASRGLVGTAAAGRGAIRPNPNPTAANNSSSSPPPSSTSTTSPSLSPSIGGSYRSIGATSVVSAVTSEESEGWTRDRSGAPSPEASFPRRTSLAIPPPLDSPPSDASASSTSLSSSPTSTTEDLATRRGITLNARGLSIPALGRPTLPSSPPANNVPLPILPESSTSASRDVADGPSRPLPSAPATATIPVPTFANPSVSQLSINTTTSHSSAASSNGDLNERSNTSTPIEARMRALPRLLSSDAYALPRVGSTLNGGATNGEHGDETDTEEDEEETETEASETDDESGGERYESARGSLAEMPPPPVPSTSSNTPLNSSPAQTRLSLGMTPTASTSTSSPFVPSSWVTFGAMTPTPGPLRTARLIPDNNSTSSGSGSAGAGAGAMSYFDLPTQTRGGTPGQPLRTPLLPMSAGDQARGKRPVIGGQVQETPSSSPQQAKTSNHDRSRTAGGALEVPPGAVGESEGSGTVGSSGYRARSHSAVAIMSPSLLDSDEEPVGTAALTLDPVWQDSRGPSTPGPAFLLSPPVSITSTIRPSPTSPAGELSASTPAGGTASPTTSPVKASGGGNVTTPGAGSKLTRRRSMYELHVQPPAYHAEYARAGFKSKQIVYPREEEGREGLPEYTCAVHFEGYLPRKMEFTAPNVQARDRAWKRQYIVLHGTSIKIYKYDLRTHPIEGEEDWSTITADIAGHDGPPPLHFHEGQYGEAEATTGSKFGKIRSDAKEAAKAKLRQVGTSGVNQLIKHYSLQNAESGLAADYTTRTHVVRVRAENEQFLVQCRSDRGVIDLIEALQAATNVALDLDARPLPKFLTLPRRRRRRRPRPVDGTAAGGTANPATEGDAAARAAAEAEAAAAPDRLGDMLAEEQNAYANAPGGASQV